jgi:hypothetical protein
MDQARGDHRHPTVVHPHSVGKHGLDKAAAWQDRYQLTLWCEHADQPHPWPPSASPSGAATDERDITTERRSLAPCGHMEVSCLP